MSDTPSVKISSDEAVKAAKKTLLANKKSFALHVGLVERQDACPVGDARAIAYAEGSTGLSKRLGQKVLA